MFLTPDQYAFFSWAADQLLGKVATGLLFDVRLCGCVWAAGSPSSGTNSLEAHKRLSMIIQQAL